MHLIIKNKTFKKIKNFLINSYNFFKNEDIHIETTKNSLTIHTNNENFYISINLDKSDNLNILKTGKTSINTKTLNSLIDSIKEDDNLEIYSAENNYLQFFSGNFNCKLLLKDQTNKYLRDININGLKKIEISYQIFKSIQNKLKDFYINNETSVVNKEISSNINFNKKIDTNKLQIIAYDQYRVIVGSFDYLLKNEFEVNINFMVLNLMLGIFSEYSKENVNIYLDEINYFLIFKKNEYLIQTKIDSSQFPEFLQWFNTEKKVSFEINKKVLLEAINRNLLFSDKYKKTAIYQLEESQLFLEYKDIEKGTCRETLNIKNIKNSEKIEFFINNHLLKSLIKTINSENLIFHIHNPLKPIIISSDNSDDNFQQFILPSKYA